MYSLAQKNMLGEGEKELVEGKASQLVLFATSLEADSLFARLLLEESRLLLSFRPPSSQFFTSSSFSSFPRCFSVP